MKAYLLDTCALIKWAVNPADLKEEARLAIASGRNIVFVSAVTALEIAVKQSIGKLGALPALQPLLDANRFRELPIRMHHASDVANLPLIHKDPFDRLLISQANLENLTLITTDRLLAQYEVELLLA